MAFNEFLVLEDILGDLPEIQDYKPKLGYGTRTDMQRWIAQKRKEKVAYYPIIWIQTPFELTGKPFATGDINIILANLANENMSNVERTQVSFVRTLDPLLDSVLYALNSYTGIHLDESDNFNLTRHFNYDTEAKHVSTDIWDAITVRTEIEFNLNCL